jgi:hypothetical protein
VALDPCSWGGVRRSVAAVADRADCGRVAPLWGDREHVFGPLASTATLWRWCDERIDTTRLRAFGRRARMRASDLGRREPPPTTMAGFT